MCRGVRPPSSCMFSIVSSSFFQSSSCHITREKHYYQYILYMLRNINNFHDLHHFTSLFPDNPGKPVPGTKRHLNQHYQHFYLTVYKKINNVKDKIATRINNMQFFNTGLRCVYPQYRIIVIAEHQFCPGTPTGSTND